MGTLLAKLRHINWQNRVKYAGDTLHQISYSRHLPRLAELGYHNAHAQEDDVVYYDDCPIEDKFLPQVLND